MRMETQHKRGSSISFSPATEVRLIPRAEFEDFDVLFYSDDELADFRYEAFLERVGLAEISDEEEENDDSLSCYGVHIDTQPTKAKQELRTDFQNDIQTIVDIIDCPNVSYSENNSSNFEQRLPNDLIVIPIEDSGHERDRISRNKRFKDARNEGTAKITSAALLRNPRESKLHLKGMPGKGKANPLRKQSSMSRRQAIRDSMEKALGSKLDFYDSSSEYDSSIGNLLKNYLKLERLAP